MTFMTPSQYKSFIAANSKERAKTSKYRAKPTTIDGIRFHSKKEADYYQKLKHRQEKGEISRFHRQILFDLPGGIKHYVDFMVIKNVYAGYLDNPDLYELQIEYIEVKGRDTPLGKMKRKQCEQIYNIEIKLV